MDIHKHTHTFLMANLQSVWCWLGSAPPAALIRLSSTGLMGSAALSPPCTLPRTVCSLFAQDVSVASANKVSLSSKAVAPLLYYFFLPIFPPPSLLRPSRPLLNDEETLSVCGQWQ